MRLQSSHKPTSAEGAELIAADGKCIWIKCSLEAAGIGCNDSVTKYFGRNKQGGKQGTLRGEFF